MSRARLYDRLGRYGFPRVSGDEPATFSQPEETLTFSPRERG